MTAIPTVSLSDLIERYDVFFIDQFGVLRDDEGAYPGATDALAHVKAAGKTVVILSNSGRSGDYNAQRFVTLGFARSSFDHFVTSGDTAFAVLSSREVTSTSTRAYTISSGGDRNLAERLGLSSVDDLNNADLLIISGSEAEKVPMETYAETLRPAAVRGVPAICTNPDIHKLAGGTMVPGAGSIAALYENLGGKVRWFGKPHQDIYAQAMAQCGHPPRHSIVCIGDSVDHDIVGANSADLASVLVMTGISAGRLQMEPASTETAGGRPDCIMSAFR